MVTFGIYSFLAPLKCVLILFIFTTVNYSIFLSVLGDVPIKLNTTAFYLSPPTPTPNILLPICRLLFGSYSYFCTELAFSMFR